eukprot:COSAG02_NODE_567_length_20212_cov_18.927460_3_plen_50_part_00
MYCCRRLRLRGEGAVRVTRGCKLRTVDDILRAQASARYLLWRISPLRSV